MICQQLVGTVLAHPTAITVLSTKTVPLFSLPISLNLSLLLASYFLSIDDIYTAVTNRHTSIHPTLAALHESNPVGLPNAMCKVLTCYNDCNNNGCCDQTIGECKCDDGYSGADCSDVHSTSYHSFV